MDLLVLCPSRARPEAAAQAYESFTDTRRLSGSQISFVIDDDDPTIHEYVGDYSTIQQSSPGNMVAALNQAALWAIEHWGPRYIGFIGDDHRFRTSGWDAAIVGLLDARGGGLAYGNDLFWPKGEIPTQIFMSSSIVSALGWMGLPTCTHLYIDNAWRVIGESLARLFYMPDIIVEHLHPAGGKAPWDEGHLRVNTPEMYNHDRLAFEEWLRTEATRDIERVRSALS